MNACQKDFLAKKHCNIIMGGGGGEAEENIKVKKYTILNDKPVCVK